MAHEVETAFYARHKAWHGLGTVVSEAKNSKEAIVLAGINWKVLQQPIYLQDGREIPDRMVNVRDSDGAILGVVSDHYKYENPEQAFEFTDALLENDEVEVLYDACGSLFKGKRIWLCAHLPQRMILGDAIDNHLVFATSYDGSLANTVVMTPNRVDCNNMLTMAINKAKRKWTYKHIGDIASKRHEAAQTIKLAGHYMDELEKEAENLQQKRVTREMLEEIIDEVFPIDEEKDSDRIKRNVSEFRNTFVDIYSGAPDLQRFTGTAWGVYNAFGDFATHIQPQRASPTFAETLFSSFLDGNKLLLAAQKAIEKVTA